ncbi:DUF885 domain-containing protein [Parasphingopyxis lamellibrachiae]|uniref:Uncharacterized protein (DUF885 family) n=1 Tax=Parasphingopyxis lamellibrachiae TaxID=680125 RepID=A0A3D9FKT3_9SPHN|nr:DUF885 domain-containing protein [Parasphingopyxis lamellibrachiae]RED17681.1 uncharacterized protein (DUF885 family) [Parasphingopyxis lamellibrachiae]
MRALILALALGTAMPAWAAPDDDLEMLMDEVWASALRDSPVMATRVGVHDYDDQVFDISLAAQDRRAAEAQAYRDRLRAIPQNQLSADGQTNFGILDRLLSETIEGNGFGQRVMLFTTYSGWHQSFAGLANALSFQTPSDFESYLTRLSLYPTINDEAIAISTQAVEQGYTLPCAVLDGYERSISGVIGDDPLASRFYAPFTRPRPSGVSEEAFAGYAARAHDIITNILAPEYTEHLEWYLNVYRPACREEVGISAQEGGADYYAFRVRQMTTTDLTAQEIHDIGLSEVARIRAEMEAVTAEAGFETREAYIEHLRTDPQYYAETPEELMAAVALQAKEIDGLMPTMFATLPRLPYGIRAIPDEIAEGTTTAYYSPGSPESGIAGTYYVNTSLLDQRPLWEIPALTAHEGVPGHHNQIALQQEIEMHPLRQNLAFFTAFTEGWGLYSERIGIEIGLYDTPAENMGRLSYEMWRACRLVVDTGIHALGWSKEQAIAFMSENTALTDANIEAEVNRYISWPGQALGYKMGELRIRALRARAEAALGENFDVRHFHDAVIGQGSVPLDVLEGQIDRWIAAQLSELDG